MTEISPLVPGIPISGSANILGPSTDVPDEPAAQVRALDPVPDLVARAKEGDKDAFGQLYQLYHAPVLRMARLKVGTDADDLVADVFLRAWTALPRYRDTGAPFVSWLFGIARNVVADEFRRRARTVPSDDVPDHGVETDEDQRMTLADAIDALPDEQRQVIELKFLVGMRNPEVARALEITTAAVNAKQWRALAALRDLLGEVR